MRCVGFNINEAIRLFTLAQNSPEELREAIALVEDSVYASEHIIDETRMRAVIQKHGQDALRYYTHVRECDTCYDSLLRKLVKDRKIQEEEFDNALEGMRRLHRAI